LMPIALVKHRQVSLLLLAALVLVGFFSMLTPEANAQDVPVHLRSIQDNDASHNCGHITINGLGFLSLPTTVYGPPGTTSLRYWPTAQCIFVRWESTGPITFTNSLARQTNVNIQGEGTITAIYAAPAVAPAVGGIVQSTNTLAILAPYLTLIGVVATASAAYVMKRRRKA
jgi:hypothetical protein